MATISKGCGVCSSHKNPSIIASSASDRASKKNAPLRSSQSNDVPAISPTGILLLVNHSMRGSCRVTEKGGPGPPQSACQLLLKRGRHSRHGIATILGGHTVEPSCDGIRVCREPSGRRITRLFPIVQDRTHNLVFHGEREFEIVQQRADIFT